MNKVNISTDINIVPVIINHISKIISLIVRIQSSGTPIPHNLKIKMVNRLLIVFICWQHDKPHYGEGPEHDLD